jgi:transcriptional regulator with XRE-family HTH domain
MQISGKELRVQRTTADITVTALAARMGLSRQSVWVLERSAIVSPQRAEQYCAALRDAIETSEVDGSAA